MLYYKVFSVLIILSTPFLYVQCGACCIDPNWNQDRILASSALELPENTEQFMYAKTEQSGTRRSSACGRARIQAKELINSNLNTLNSQISHHLTEHLTTRDNSTLLLVNKALEEARVDSAYQRFDSIAIPNESGEYDCAHIEQFDKYLYINEIELIISQDSVLSTTLENDDFIPFYKELLNSL